MSVYDNRSDSTSDRMPAPRVAVMSLLDMPGMAKMRRTLFPTMRECATGAGRAYLMCYLDGHLDNRSLGMGGDVFASTQTFDSVADAEQWIRDDIAQRLALQDAETGRVS